MIYFDSPIFSNCSNRDKMDNTICFDIVSFIHLVRLNLPCALVGGDAKEFGRYSNYLTRIGSSYYPSAFWYIPKKNEVMVRLYKPDKESGYPEMTLGYDIDLPDNWNLLLSLLKNNKLLFSPPPLMEAAPFKLTSIKRVEDGFEVKGVANGHQVDGIYTEERVAQFVGGFPRMFAPTDDFKGKAKSVLSAKDLPFDVY